ncbi:MAG: serine--tRNA ligase [Psychroflexus sp.]|jgi:seryl-tRNA synthetase|nr:serine--tRNA ligase [Psychroflexus sp.]MDR9447596.1 serine--tRNA ligase [Psychroflexus sp.]
MLDTKKIIAHKSEFIKALDKRHFNAESLFEKIIQLDESRRHLQSQKDDASAEMNKVSKEIGNCFKNGEKEKAEELKQKTTSLKEKVKDLSQKLDEVSSSLQDVLYQIPNTPHASVKKGKDENDNEELYRKGKMPDFDIDPKPHWELAKQYNLIDFEKGNKLTGAGFPVYKGKAAKLQRALINYFLNENEKAGYDEVQVPLLVNPDSGTGTGQLPDKEGQMYHIGQDDLYLIPTAEVPITNLHRSEILRKEDLPIKYTGYTPCFRREAGSYGAHVRGLNRLHQFDKVEIVHFEEPAHSYNALEEMADHIEHLLQKLELPYRKLRLCGGDLGFTSALTYDFEVYSAAQEKWLEVSSVSNFESYQTRRLQVRYNDQDNKKQFVHTLNGSALALPRILACILENNQTKEGIKVPKVVQPLLNFSVISG